MSPTSEAACNKRRAIKQMEITAPLNSPNCVVPFWFSTGIGLSGWKGNTCIFLMPAKIHPFLGGLSLSLCPGIAMKVYSSLDFPSGKALDK